MTQGPARQPGRPPPPLEPAHDPAAAEARLRRQVQLGHVAPLVRRHGPPRPRHRRRPDRPPVVDRAVRPRRHTATSRRPATACVIHLPKTALKPEVTFEWKIPQWSNTIERDRARTYFQAYAAAAALHFIEKALADVRAGKTKTWEPFEVPDEGIGCGFTEAVRGVLSHHMVIKGGKIANYHPYPPTPWNANPRDIYGTPGPYEDAVMNTPIFEENDLEQLQGHRHHADRAQLRPVPAVRGAHVPRQGQGAEEGALADSGRSTTTSWPRLGPMPELGAPQPDESVGDATAEPPGRRRPDRGAARRAPGQRRSPYVRPGRGAAPPGDRALRRGPGPGRRARSRSRLPSCSTVLVDDELRREPPRRARPAPARPGHPGRRPRWTRCGRSSQGHGGDVELLDIDEAVGAVHLRLLGSCDGCPSSAVTLQHAVERAIVEAAPEIVTIDVEEPNAPDAPGVTTAVALGRKPEVAVR